jgi:hypothetical protein
MPSFKPTGAHGLVSKSLSNIQQTINQSIENLDPELRDINHKVYVISRTPNSGLTWVLDSQHSRTRL